MTREQHEEFYKFTGHAQDRPRYTMHFNLDVPVRALLPRLQLMGEGRWEGGRCGSKPSSTSRR